MFIIKIYGWENNTFGFHPTKINPIKIKELLQDLSNLTSFDNEMILSELIFISGDTYLYTYENPEYRIHDHLTVEILAVDDPFIRSRNSDITEVILKLFYSMDCPFEATFIYYDTMLKNVLRSSREKNIIFYKVEGESFINRKN